MRTTFYALAYKYLTDDLMVRPRSASVFLSLFGLRGAENKTLQETAKEFAMSRERVRQIKESVFKQFESQGVRFRSSMVDALFGELVNTPTSSTVCLKFLDDEIESIAPIYNFLELFGDKSNAANCVHPPAKESEFSQAILVPSHLYKDAMAVRMALSDTYDKNSAQKAMVIIDLDGIAKTAKVAKDTTYAICSAFYGPYILDKAHSPYFLGSDGANGHHLVLPSSDNKILNIIEKQSVLVDGVSLQVLAASAHRYSRSKEEKRTSPSPEALRIYLTHLYDVDLEADWVAFNNITRHGEQHLPESERLLLKALKPGEAVDYATLRDRMIGLEMNFATVNVCIFRSPLLICNDTLYSLVSENK